MRYNMKNLMLACILLQIVLIPANGQYTIYRAKVLTKVNNWVTSWITTSQLTTILDYMEPRLNSTTTSDDAENAAVTIVMQTLTTSQMMSAVGIGTGFLFSYGGYTQPMNISMTAILNNLTPFIGQLRKMKAKAEANSWTNDQTFTKAYKMVDIFFTYRCTNIIFCRTGVKLEAYKKGIWAYCKSKMSSMINFSAMNYTLGACYP